MSLHFFVVRTYVLLVEYKDEGKKHMHLYGDRRLLSSILDLCKSESMCRGG